MQVPVQALGKTGISVSRMGIGLAALGRPGYINIGHAEDLAYNYVVEAMEKRTHRLLNTAYEQGVRYIDVARSYGRAETFLKSWIDTYQPQDVVIASKWGYTYTANWEVETDVHEIKDHSLENFNKQWELSSALLHQLRIYQIHSATLDSGVLDKADVLKAMAGLKAQGLKVGLSLSGPEQVEVLTRALDKEIDGLPLFDVVQPTFNVLEQSAGPLLSKAADRGLGVVIKEALANGRLTSRNEDPSLADCLPSLHSMAEEKGVAIDAIALAFVLAQPWAHVVLSGAAVENHLLSNLDALKIKLSKEEIAKLENMAQGCSEYWSTRANMAWN